MIIGYIQTDPIFGEKEQNFQQIENLLKGVSVKKADNVTALDVLSFDKLVVTKEALSALRNRIGG